MEVTRRGLLGLASAAGAISLGGARAAQAAPGVADQGAARADHAELIARIRAFAEADLADKGFPGMTLALIGPDGFSAAIPVGWADAERRLPVTTDHLFQIGSISKSALALAVFALAHAGRLDLDARVADLLPGHPLPPEPITVTQLLNHSAGLPGNAPPFPPVPGGRLWTGYEPGTRFSYSNLGYVLLGDIVERVSGMTAGKAIEALVLRPLGMTGAEPVIRIADRSRYATGYTKRRDDLPWMPLASLTPAQWIDWHWPSGAIAATPADMTAYLAYLVRLGRGEGAPLFSDTLARRFVAPGVEAAQFGAGASYNNGLIHRPVDGRPTLHHTGGTLGFTASLTVDPAAGVGCYAGVNVGGGTGYRPSEITDHACTLLRAVAEGRVLGEARRPQRPPPIADPGRFTGRWVSQDGELSIVERDGRLVVAAAGQERPLRTAGATALVTDHPALPAPRLALEGGAAPLLRLGDRLYGRERAPPPTTPDPRLAKLAGSYYNPGMWESRMRVLAIGDTLFIGLPPANQVEDGSWRFADTERAAERAWFENLVDGRPQQLNMSGTLFERVRDEAL